MRKSIVELILSMTLEEKASLCSGADFWHTKAIERLGIPSIRMSDGPHGLRKQKQGTDFTGMNESEPATCYPSAVSLASSWDRALIKEMGMALGDECKSQSVSLLLGPGVNIKRSPLCGRNFEYFSEDPYLSSELAADFIDGVQSRGIGATIKHFAANNQEERRMTVDAHIDERTLREIYLASFESAIKRSKPWGVMAAYNRLNGKYCCENSRLLHDILRKEWGYGGVVISDWTAVDEIVDAVGAGMNLEMPSSYGVGPNKIVTAVRKGTLPEYMLDQSAQRITELNFNGSDNKQPDFNVDYDAHHRLARSIAADCIVLLKNNDSILPLRKSASVAIIGAFAKNPRYQGGGSSHVNPTKLDIPFDEIKSVAGAAEIPYCDGYSIDSDEINNDLINKALETAGRAQITIIFAGLPDRYESEGYDRQHLRLPDNQNALINAIAKTNSHVVVVLMNGSPVEMPWANKVGGIVEAYLVGQAVGGAIADILYGITNPCGKLAETFPSRLCDNPSYINFPGEKDRVNYSEGLFVGYRHYDKLNIPPLFPFGHGLSYTIFKYSELTLDKENMTDADKLKVSVKVRNVGGVAGKEIVQLYVTDLHDNIIRPTKELKGFEKVFLMPDEEKTATFELDKRSFAYYNTDIKDWHVQTGRYMILIGKSSREIVLKAAVHVTSTRRIKKNFNRNTTIGDLLEDVITTKMLEDFLNKFGSLGQMLNTNTELERESVKNTPLRTLVVYTHGVISDVLLNDFINLLNTADQIIN